jgi:ubiquinone/menaquinone biosynthesis C-methylase UbiE
MAEAELSDEANVEKHYASDAITARVLAALRDVEGPDVAITPDTLAPIDHFHGRGVAATQELAASMQPKPTDHLLDVGCGIAGPARWIATKYGCHVTRVDLTSEFCLAARELNAATGPCRRVTIVHGSALALPVPEESYSHAYSHAGLINISDKRGVFQEIFRVLRSGGLLALLAA